MPGPYYDVDTGAVAFTPSGADGGAQPRVIEVAAREGRIRGGGCEVLAATFENSAKGVERGGQGVRNRNGGTQTLRARQERGANLRDELLEVLAVGRAERYSVDDDL